MDDPDGRNKSPSGASILGNPVESQELTDDSENFLTRFDLVKRVLSIEDTSKSMKTKIVASLVPDEVIYNAQKDKEQYYNGAILFADISGFTDLTEKYCSMGKGGPSRLSQVLNNYIGAMVQEIMSHMGDILKFSGDAFLALWKSTDNAPMTEVVHSAIDCALSIQKSHGIFKTEVGVLLRVKIAISAGQLIYSPVQSSFLMIGNPIWDVKGSGDLCGPGDIIVSQIVTTYVNKGDYNMNQMTDGMHLKILGIGPDWSPIQYSSQYERFDEYLTSNTSIKDEDLNLFNPYSAEELNITLHDYTLRPSIDYAVHHYLIDYLSNFIIRPVWRIIEVDEPLEYLTEMRQVIVVFVNVVLEKTTMSNLIGYTDKINSVVYNVSTSYDGCVNKLSMFDKDLMFLVIFGLRGFKHTLETQMALRCAKEIQRLLRDLPYVKSASIGVTSGLTYCGVVGHPLRREYTVIGRVVNKAARLMVAYVDKVTCDQQTFLNSRLSSMYFTLQPPLPLKGFKYVGPVYEFDEPAEMEGDVERGLPLLGREWELFQCTEFINNALRYQRATVNTFTASTTTTNIEELHFPYNTLLILGKPRQGKTSLLNEVLRTMKSPFPVHKITLTIYDQKFPYRTIQQIFSQQLGLQDSMTIEQRTHQVGYFLHKIKVPHFLCALNDILNVEFEETAYYNGLTDAMKHVVRTKMIKYLCLKCFPKLWMIVIDNGENIDNKSWPFIKNIIDLDLVLMILTMGSMWKSSSVYKSIEESERVKIVVLEIIDKWYHAAIVCQMLNVEAIPLELEKIIQDHSSGNPGWIDSFLTTLLQSGEISKITATVEWVYRMGYVRPPKSMLTILSDNEGNLQEESDIEMKPRWHGWDMYHNTYKANLTVFDMNEMRICSISPDFNISEILGDDKVDGKMMRTYDSLSLKEQLLLKCSSVLGDLFSRAMLIYMIPTVTQLEIAHIVQKLFEIRVLVCARGDFRDNFTHIIHTRFDPDTEEDIKCDCLGLKIDSTCVNLPKYANCGYMRFRETKFRIMLYNLLTDNQMKQYHTRAIWFLENETRRCRACGGGFFYHLNGMTFDDGMKSKHKVKIVPKLMTNAELTVLTNFHPEYLSQGRLHTQSSKLDKSRKNEKPFFRRHAVFTSQIRKFNGSHIIDCECRLILATMYKYMVVHCRAAEMHNRGIHVLLEYANLSVEMNNSTIAFRVLRRAEGLLNTKLKPTFSDPEWQEPIIRGKIYTITGYLHRTREKYNDSLKSLKKAIECFGLKFPSTKTEIKLATKKQETLLYMMLKVFYRKMVGSDDSDDCLLYNQTSEALAHLFELFKITEQWDEAYLAAIWSLNQALKADSVFFTLCQAYANYIEVCNYKNVDITTVEQQALKLCFRKETKMEIHELEAILKLYAAIFFTRITRMTYNEALHIGRLILHVHVSLYLRFFKWQLIVLLQHILIMTHCIPEAIRLIEQVHYLAEDESNYLGPMLFYGICIDIRLMTGYCVVPFEKCEKYFYGNKMMKKPETYTEKFFYVCLWLWYVRLKNWESASILFKYVQMIEEKDFTHPTHILMNLYKLEGLLIIIVDKINKEDHIKVKYFSQKVEEILKIFETFNKKMKMIRPRINHLRAYWKAIISKTDPHVFKLLDLAEKQSEKYENHLEVISIQNSRKAWKGLPITRTKQTWEQMSEEDQFVDWESLDSNSVIPRYTFPLPKH